MTYMRTKLTGRAVFLGSLNFTEAEFLIFTTGLGKSLLKANYTTDRILSDERLNLIYNNGFSSIATRS